MDFTALQTLLASLAALQQEVVDAQALVDQAYQKGFADGVASVVVPPASDKIYSEEELQAKVAEAVAPLQKKIEELEVVVAGVDQKIADALAAFKAELLAKYNEFQVAETAAEVGFADLLK